MNKLITSLFTLLTVFGSHAFSIETKNARSNDVATTYILEDNGNFFRTIKNSGLKCQITSRVESFKVSQHPNDVAMVYYKKADGGLYILKNSTEASAALCPKASTGLLMPSVKKYNVVSNTNTTIVNTALDVYGKFVAWDNTSAVFAQLGVVDYEMHNKYNVSGAPFSSYVVFAISTSGHIIKVKGENPSESKVDSTMYFSDLNDFKTRNNILN